METFKGYAKGFLYLKDPETFQKRYPEMYEAMKEAEKEGVISSENVQALKGVASGERKYGNEEYAFQPDDSMLRKTGRVISSELEKGMGFMAGSEKASRAVAYVMAYENAPEGVDKKAFSKNFVDDTMFVYDKINQPQIAQGPIANVVTLFKMFPLNWLSLFRRNISQGEYGAAARMLGATMAMGGVRALPFAKPAIGIAKGLGYQPESALREALGPEHEKLADAAIYGVPAAITPFNISGASAPADIVPDPERGLAEAVASSMGGIPFGFAMRAGGAIENMSKGGDMSRSVEMMLPDTAKNLVSGARAAKNQAFTDLRGNDVLPVEGIVEPMTRMLGMQPTALTKSYSLINAEKEIAQTTKDLAVNDDIGRALAKGNIEGAKLIVQKARAHNIKYKDQPEMQIKLDGAAIKKVAKLANLPAWLQVILTSPKRSRGAQIEEAKQTPSIIKRTKADEDKLKRQD